MRWDMLFRDLESEFESQQAVELHAEVADRTRREMADIRLVDRLRPAIGQELRLQVVGVGRVAGVLQDVGAEWMLLNEAAGREAVVPLPAVLSVSGVGARSAAPGSEGVVVARLGLGSALRRIARDRSPVALTLVDGSGHAGTIDRVGADFLEVADHPMGEPRRRGQVRGVSAVPLAALAVVRSWS